jgi:hypothetical protein
MFIASHHPHSDVKVVHVILAVVSMKRIEGIQFQFKGPTYVLQ